MRGPILVPLDGSTWAERALPRAVALARAGGQPLVLVRAAQVPMLLNDFGGRRETEAVEHAATYLESVATNLMVSGLEVVTDVIYGEPVRAILEAIAERQPELVVMATHDRQGLGRLFQGSVAEAVLAGSSAPLLLVREVQEARPAGAGRVLVPLDGSEFAEAALPLARELAARLGSELVLVQVVAVPEHARRGGDGRVVAYLDQTLRALESEAQRHLQRVALELAEEDGGPAPTVEVRAGEPAVEIAAAARELGAGLIVMATHGRTGLQRMLLGSVAAATLHASELPLLLVRPATVERVREQAPRLQAAAAR